MERLNTYSLVKSELETYTRTHQAASGPVPMDIGAMSKGKNPKGGGKAFKGKFCRICNKSGHEESQC
eukprot:1430605-Amphidinium_carterae.1